MNVSCPPDCTGFAIDPAETRVCAFFKQFKAGDWSFYNFCNCERSSQYSFNSIKQKWQSNLETMKNLEGIPESVQQFVGRLYSQSKKLASMPSNPAPPAVTISSSTVGTLYVGNNSNNTVIYDDTSTVPRKRTRRYPDGDRNEERGGQDYSNEDEIEVDTAMYAVNPSLRSLYPYLYQLHHGQAVDIDRIYPKYTGNTLHDKVYEYARGAMKQFTGMKRTEYSFLLCALSGVVNMVSESSNPLAAKIPQTTLNEVRSIAQGSVDIKQHRVSSKIDQLNKIFKNDGLTKLHSTVATEKAAMLASARPGDVVELTDEYKVYEIIEIMINEVKFGKWDNSKSEEEYLFYWKKVLDVVFRGTKNVCLKIGELTSASTKFDRMINEHEYGETVKYVSGRKIDLIVQCQTVDIRNNPKHIELSSVELKRIDIASDFIDIQRNKNLRTLKSLLANLIAITSAIDVVVGMDIIGLAGHLFTIVPYCGITFAASGSEDAIFLPGNEVDLGDFLGEKKLVIELLFSYKDHIDKQAQACDHACRKAQRERSLKKGPDTYDTDLLLPPTLYSPKR